MDNQNSPGFPWRTATDSASALAAALLERYFRERFSPGGFQLTIHRNSSWTFTFVMLIFISGDKWRRALHNYTVTLHQLYSKSHVEYPRKACPYWVLWVFSFV